MGAQYRETEIWTYSEPIRGAGDAAAGAQDDGGPALDDLTREEGPRIAPGALFVSVGEVT